MNHHFPTKRNHNEVPWTPPFQAECTNGHSVRASAPIKTCPACVHGQPCEGSLQRFGTGSRTTTVAKQTATV